MRSSARKTIKAKAAKAGPQPGFTHRPGSGTKGVRRLVNGIPGRPGMGLTTQSFRPIGFTETLKPIFRKRSIRIVHKQDIAKGLTQPEAGRITTTKGVLTGSNNSFASKATEVSKNTMVATGRNRKVIKAPSLTSGAGVRSPFNPKRRVGRKRG